MTMSKIEWTDRTWNPVTGCTKVSPGCDHCYAEGIARRFAGTPAFPDGFAVTLHPERLDAPRSWRKPSRVFVNSMSDLFHDEVPTKFIAKVFAVMAATPQHTYQLLTKRHGRMRSLLTSVEFEWDIFDAGVPGERTRVGPAAGWPLPNVWLGVSVEDQKRADLRIPALLDIPAAVRFLSCEPLLGAVDLTPYLFHQRGERWPREDLHWVIAGGESGPGARPMHPEWARGLRDQCTEAGVPFFFKQWGAWGPVDDLSDWIHGARWIEPGGRFREFAEWPGLDEARAQGMQLMQSSRRGPKATGRELDGCTWDEFPAVTP